MNSALIAQACRDSVVLSKPFPQVLAILAEARVERYHTDLVRRETVHYDATGKSATRPLSIPLHGEVPLHGDMTRLRAAIADSQQGRHTYQEFLQKIFSAGFPSYYVYLAGRKAVYVDRRGDCHEELFPAGIL